MLKLRLRLNMTFIVTDDAAQRLNDRLNVALRTMTSIKSVKGDESHAIDVARALEDLASVMRRARACAAAADDDKGPHDDD